MEVGRRGGVEGFESDGGDAGEVDVEVGDWDPDVGGGGGGVASGFHRVPGLGVGVHVLAAGGVVLLEGDAEFVAAAIDDVEVVLRVRSKVSACLAQTDIEVV